MTTKDTLHQTVDALSESEAESFLKLAEEAFQPGPLSDDDRAAIARRLADVRAGRVVSTDDVRRRFNLPA